jgi:hypothetical protein
MQSSAMKVLFSKLPILAIELSAVYGATGYLYTQKWIPPSIFFLIIAFSGLMFSLYYGTKGAFSSAILTIFLLFWTLQENILVFLSNYYIEASFLAGGLLITGFIKSGLERRIIGTELGNQIVNERLERLFVELSEKDKALQDAFREVLTDMESPRIMYQTIRRLEYITDRETLFNEILYILYSHCHADKSSIYEIKGKNRFRRVASFGASELPDLLRWKSEKMPEVLRVARVEKEIVIPTRFNHRFIMAIPLISSSGNLLYILLIEEIRFISLNESLLNLLKATAFWIKHVVEGHFHREEFLPLSAFDSVIVYRPDLYKKVLRQSIASHKKYGLPYAVLEVKGVISEDSCKQMASMLRVHDEFFLIADNQLLVLLTMILENNVAFVRKRLNDAFPDLRVERLKKIPFA